jgi:tRNA dimethylallyltransferase
MAKEAIRGIASRGHLPILCGGTGFYIQAVTRDINFTETGAREARRAEMLAFAEKEGNEALHKLLAAVDPDSARTIHPNNVKRVIRAIEYFEETGQSIYAHNEEEKLKESPYDLHYFVIAMDRAKLYERIDRRVDFMMEEGLYDEVLYLKAMGLSREDVSMQGLGYKEMLDCMDGLISLEETVRILKRDTRHFAKRQITWFKREKDALWIDRADFGNDSIRIAEFMKDQVCK